MKTNYDITIQVTLDRFKEDGDWQEDLVLQYTVRDFCF